ncbi:hypothetical protein [Thorsellia anophelis]|uniref:hypothetical protein n=1 Tax=Thorsellia anophelis TaxID=336804 RepID=UPI0015A5793E|nr:hypothetical protein [Thorsellia anophelis]
MKFLIYMHQHIFEVSLNSHQWVLSKQVMAAGDTPTRLAKTLLLIFECSQIA